MVKIEKFLSGKDYFYLMHLSQNSNRRRRSMWNFARQCKLIGLDRSDVNADWPSVRDQETARLRSLKKYRWIVQFDMLCEGLTSESIANGDTVVVMAGKSSVLGVAEVTGKHSFEPSFKKEGLFFDHIRPVKWKIEYSYVDRKTIPYVEFENTLYRVQQSTEKEIWSVITNIDFEVNLEKMEQTDYLEFQRVLTENDTAYYVVSIAGYGEYLPPGEIIVIDDDGEIYHATRNLWAARMDKLSKWYKKYRPQIGETVSITVLSINTIKISLIRAGENLRINNNQIRSSEQEFAEEISPGEESSQPTNAPPPDDQTPMEQVSHPSIDEHRDTTRVKWVKNSYAHNCQICLSKEAPIILNAQKSYSEIRMNRRLMIQGHHIKEIKKDMGHDHVGNILSLCIYHHLYCLHPSPHEKSLLEILRRSLDNACEKEIIWSKDNITEGILVKTNEKLKDGTPLNIIFTKPHFLELKRYLNYLDLHKE